MEILVVGGTSFVGRAIVLAAVEAGHRVSVLNRGRTPSDLPSEVERLVGDRSGDLAALAGRAFGATVDVIAYRPSDVARLHEALGERGGHHLQISSVSAYEDPAEEGSTESSARIWPDGGVDPDAPLTATNYGPLKAACEREAVARFGASTTIVRPTYVVGAHDATLRFPYWVARCRRGGAVAVPGPREVAMQYLDARDLGGFVVSLLDARRAGAFTAAGPWPPDRFVSMVETVARAVAPRGTSIVEVDPAEVARLGLEARFPLWSGPSSEPALAMDPTAALSAGLVLRSLAESVEDVAAWWGEREWPEQWLREADEADLLAGTSRGR